MSVSTCGLWGVDRGSLIGNLSNEPIVVVSSVGGGLDSSVRESNGERSGNFALSILSLGLLEVVLRVVISYSIFIGKWLRGELLLLVDCWRRGTIGGGACRTGDSHQGRGKGDLRLGEV